MTVCFYFLCTVLFFANSVLCVTGADAVSRAMQWVNVQMPYCQAANHAHDADTSCASTCTRTGAAATPEWDPYRSDCSGLVAWAWGLPAPGPNTAGLFGVAATIQGSDLQPGDAICIASDHVILFVSWVTMGSEANFIEEPGCSASPNYAHAFQATTSISGSTVTVNGMSYTAIRGNAVTGQGSATTAANAGTSGMSNNGTSGAGGSTSAGTGTGTGSAGSSGSNAGTSGVASSSGSGASTSAASGCGFFGLFGCNSPSSSAASSSAALASSGSSGGLFSGFGFGGASSQQVASQQASSGSASSPSSSSLFSWLAAKPVTVGPCSGGVAGTCQDMSLECPNMYQSFVCPNTGPTIACCPDHAPAGQSTAIVRPGEASDAASCSSVTFPLSEGSLHHIGVNYGGARSGGTACHTGIDLFTTSTSTVIAMSDGVVVSIDPSTVPCTCTGKAVLATALTVYHASMNSTVVYGEMNPSQLTLQVGSSVTRGQQLGVADVCCLLHVEIWDGHAKHQPWTPPSGVTAQDPDGCTHVAMATKPAALGDPRPLINCLKPSYASILADAGVGGEMLPGIVPSAVVSSNAKKGISPGYIVLIVLAGLALLACIGVMVFCFVRSRRQAREVDETNIAVSNSAYSGASSTTSATSAGFKCTLCNSEYNYQSDLATHMAMRHQA